MTMLNKIFGLFGLEITAKKEVAQVAEEVKSTPRKTKEIKNVDTITSVDRNSEKERVVLRNAVEDIQGEILARGYKAIPEILAGFETECISHFVMLQEVQLGSFDKEKDTLEGLTRTQLVERALHNNQLQFRARMVEQGKVKAPSTAQLKKIEELATKHHCAVDMKKILTSFDASDMIEFLMKKYNETAPKKLDGKSAATNNQIRAVQNICKKLNLEVAADMIADFDSASRTIDTLSKQVPATEPTEARLATDKQVEYACRLWKLNGHRVTAAKKEKYAAMTTVELSKEIDEMNKEYYTNNPEANMPSKGQLDYIRQLCELTMTEIPAEMPKTKDAASKSIENLNRKYLYLLTRVTSPSLTKEEIQAMPMGTVKELLFNLKMEKRTRNYTDNSQGTGGAETGVIEF